MNVEFEVKGTIEGRETSRKYNISVKNKYLISYNSIMDAVAEVTESGNGKFQVSTDTETLVYNTDVIYYKGNLNFDGNNLDINNVSYLDSTYSIGNENDVATASTNAQNMVILKVDGNITIGEGIKLTSVASNDGYGGPKGMLIYCTGTLTNNGEISMTARGAKAEGQNVYLWKNTNGSYEYVPAIGADGGEGKRVSQSDYVEAGNNGSDGSNRQTAGGGSGAAYYYQAYSGNGTAGTSYSGGTGGGSAMYYSVKDSASGTINGGEGGYGNGTRTEAYGDRLAGGAGNPGRGSRYFLKTYGEESYQYKGTKGENGTGGLLTIFANRIENNALITSNGSKGGSNHAGGGSSGGGSINIFCKDSMTQGTITADGGR